MWLVITTFKLHFYNYLFFCLFFSQPIATVADAHYQISRQDGTLSVKESFGPDAGEYYCHVVNLVGEVNSPTTVLFIDGKHLEWIPVVPSRADQGQSTIARPQQQGHSPSRCCNIDCIKFFPPTHWPKIPEAIISLFPWSKMLPSTATVDQSLWLVSCCHSNTHSINSILLRQDIPSMVVKAEKIDFCCFV